MSPCGSAPSTLCRPCNRSAARPPAREETRAAPGTPSSCSSVSLWFVLHTHTHTQKKTTRIKTLPSQPAQKRRTQFPGGARCALLSGPRLQQRSLRVPVVRTSRGRAKVIAGFEEEEGGATGRGWGYKRSSRLFSAAPRPNHRLPGRALLPYEFCVSGQEPHGLFLSSSPFPTSCYAQTPIPGNIHPARRFENSLRPGNAPLLPAVTWGGSLA